MSKILVNSTSELPSAAKHLLQLHSNKKIFAFYGEMGAGKTTFIKTICNELGVKDLVSSPTFSLVNEYKSAQGYKIFHFDFYRIKSLNEVYDMGYEDYFYSDSYIFIEWPEKAEELLPDNVVRVSIIAKEGLRTIEF